MAIWVCISHVKDEDNHMLIYISICNNHMLIYNHMLRYGNGTVSEMNFFSVHWGSVENWIPSMLCLTV